MRLSQKADIRVRIVHANLVRFFDICVSSDIALHDITMEDEITAIFTVELPSLKRLLSICSRTNAQADIINYRGLYWKLKGLLARPVLLLGIAIVFLASVMIPRHILMVRVDGNKLIPERQILEAAENAGIYWGASRKTIRSEQVKNQLLENMPQLQWVGVNTRGCIATISVRERTPSQGVDSAADRNGIIAVRDGVIRTVHVTKGNQLCIAGQAVQAGDLLVSPYYDSGLTICITGAQGEIYAETLRKLEICIPTTCDEKGVSTGTVTRFSLQIGKKRIKLYNDSGIYGTSCDKMYKEYYLTLPGRMQMPVAVIMERWSIYDSTAVAMTPISMTDALEKSGKNYLLQEMVAGQILSSQIHEESDGTVSRIVGEYRCLEMIGRAQQEEKILHYGETG